MSHSVVLVVLKDPADLKKALAPFDENMEMDPYREYETEAPSEHWLYSSLKSSALHVENGTGILPYEPDGIGWSSDSSKKTPEEQQAELEEEAALFRTLPNPVTWAAIVALHNQRYPTDSDPMHLSEDGRAYTMSTYNPSSRWDWYAVGGRWHQYFTLKTAFRDDPRVIGGGASWGWRPEEGRDPSLLCDGAPVEMLDFEDMRMDKVLGALPIYRKFHEVLSQHPTPRSWDEVVSVVQKPESGWDAESRARFDAARDEYHAQPAVAALRATEEFKHYWGDMFGAYDMPEDEFIEMTRRNAVPGFALLTLEGEWREPGRMGWFGMSSDTPDSVKEYKEMANQYLEALEPDTYVIAVDVHI